MANDKLKLKAKANQLGITGYRTMSVEQLEAAIAGASGGSKKGKTTSTNGKVSSAPAKGKTAPTKGKTVPANKSNSQKTSPKATAAKGKASRAASTASTGWQPGSRGRVPASATKKQIAEHKRIVKERQAERAAASASAPKTPRKSTARVLPTPKLVKTKGERATIDRKQIDWQAESNVGQSGKRKEVLDALRKHKGDYDKTFELLKPNAKRYYKGKTKAEAEGLLRWLINRVAYDFVLKSGQHKPGSRVAYGTSKTGAGKTAPPARKQTRSAPTRKAAASPKKAAQAR